VVNEESVPQMRERIEDQNKELNQLRADNRKLSAREAFRDAGLNPAHGDLFAAQAVKGDITVETAKAFAEQFGLSTESPEKSTTDQETPAAKTDEPDDSALSNMSGGGSGVGGIGAATATPKLTRDEWIELQKSDPAAARQALLEGRVQLRADNFYVQNRLVNR
jgi:hypothetical protein